LPTFSAGKLEQGYVELRHFSSLTFFNGPDLAALIAPITDAFNLYRGSTHPHAELMLRRFLTVRDWLEGFRDGLSYELSAGTHVVMGFGQLRLGDEKIADLAWNGSLDVMINGSRSGLPVATAYDMQLAELPEGLAMLAMDIAELAQAGHRLPAVGSKAFRKLVLDLTKRLSAPELQSPTLAEAAKTAK